MPVTRQLLSCLFLFISFNSCVGESDNTTISKYWWKWSNGYQYKEMKILRFIDDKPKYGTYGMWISNDTIYDNNIAELLIVNVENNTETDPIMTIQSIETGEKGEYFRLGHRP